MTTCSHKISWKMRVLCSQRPDLGAFGAGSLEPEFEVRPPSEILSRVRLLALRTVSSARWTKNTQEFGTIPSGRRTVCHSFRS